MFPHGHGLSPSLVFDGGADDRRRRESLPADDEVASDVRPLEERVRELERLLGRKTLEDEILKDASPENPGPLPGIDHYAEIWAKLMGFPESVPQHWFARTSDEMALIDDRAIGDEQTVVDLCSEAGLLRTKFAAATAFDASFNAAIRRGQTEARIGG